MNETIKNNNKLIADFIGIKWHDNKTITSYPLKFNCNMGEDKIEDLKFHKSWDWVMYVLEKIEKEHDYFSKIECIELGIYNCSLNQYQFEDPDELELPEGILMTTDERVSQFEDSRLEAVYKTVVKFIKWYNENELQK